MNLKSMNPQRSMASQAYSRKRLRDILKYAVTVEERVGVYQRQGVPVPADLMQQYVARKGASE